MPKVNLKKILADPEQRKEVVGGACEFINNARDNTPHEIPGLTIGAGGEKMKITKPRWRRSHSEEHPSYILEVQVGYDTCWLATVRQRPRLRTRKWAIQSLFGVHVASSFGYRTLREAKAAVEKLIKDVAKAV